MRAKHYFIEQSAADRAFNAEIDKVLGPAPTAGFKPALAKLTIASVDDPTLQLPAQYNPSQLTLSAPVSYADSAVIKSDVYKRSLEFQGISPITAKIELFFDTFERTEKNPKGTPGTDDEYVRSVQPRIDILRQLIDVIPKEKMLSAKDYRPHLCVIVWGPGAQQAMPKLFCVIESLETTYTSWMADGTPNRAKCTISVKQCERIGADLLVDGKMVYSPRK